MTSTRWWDLAVGGVVAAMTLATLTSGVPGRSPLVALGALAALLAAYLLWGRGLLARVDTPEERPLAGLLFLLGVVLCVSVGVAAEPNLASCQALLYPMAWTLASGYRRAVWLSAVIAGAVGIGFWAGFVPLRGVLGALLIAAGVQALSLVFAVTMGTWITRIADRGEQARRLVTELTAAQGEIAQLSQAAGAAAERERLSRELHDTLTQTLTGLVMLAERAGAELPEDSPASESVLRIQRSARDALGEARSLVARTHPVGDRGLAESLRRIAERAREETGLEVTLNLAELALPREHEVVLLRCAQEGLANVRRHAAATGIRLALAGGGGAATLTLLDDGVGPGATGGEAPGAGFGLAGMRERVAQVGGRVSFGEAPGGGALLRVTLPAGPAATAVTA